MSKLAVTPSNNASRLGVDARVAKMTAATTIRVANITTGRWSWLKRC